MKARGGTNCPLTILFITWKKSLSLFNLKERRAAWTKLFSRISFDKLCSSWIKSSFSSFYFNSSAAVLSCHILIFESLPPVNIIKVGLCSAASSFSFSKWVSAKSIAQIFSSCISKELRHACLLTFQTFTIPSTLAEANYSPALSHTTFTRAILWPCSVLTH